MKYLHYLVLVFPFFAYTQTEHAYVGFANDSSTIPLGPLSKVPYIFTFIHFDELSDSQNEEIYHLDGAEMKIKGEEEFYTMRWTYIVYKRCVKTYCYDVNVNTVVCIDSDYDYREKSMLIGGMILTFILLGSVFTLMFASKRKRANMS